MSVRSNCQEIDDRRKSLENVQERKAEEEVWRTCNTSCTDIASLANLFNRDWGTPSQFSVSGCDPRRVSSSGPSFCAGLSRFLLPLHALLKAYTNVGMAISMAKKNPKPTTFFGGVFSEIPQTAAAKLKGR